MNIKIFDNGGKTFDRYTVIYLDTPYYEGAFLYSENIYIYEARGMSKNPYHPQGFGQMCAAQLGPHLGSEIGFDDLPEDCQRLVRSDLGEGI